MFKYTKNVKFFSGSRGPQGPDLLSLFGQKFQFFQFTPCLMMGEVSLETSPRNIMTQDMISSENSMNTTESTNTNIFKNMGDFGKLSRHSGVKVDY